MLYPLLYPKNKYYIYVMGYTYKNMIRLDKKNKKGYCPIVLRVTFQREYILISINEKIKVAEWNSKDEVPKRICAKRITIIDLLSEKRTKIEALINHHRLKNGEFPTISELKNLMKSDTPLKISNKGKSVFEFFDEFIVEYSKKKKLTNGTQKVYRPTKLRLLDFFEKYQRPAIWSTFDTLFYEDFTSFYIDKGYKENSIGRIIKTLKTFLKYISLNFNLVKPEQYAEFKVKKEPTSFIIINKEDLIIIKLQLGLLNSKKYKWFKKTKLELEEECSLMILLFLCLTGMSYVDFEKLTLNDIMDYDNIKDLNDESVLSIKYIRQKTNINNEVFITLTEDLIELLILVVLTRNAWFNNVNNIIEKVQKEIIDIEKYSYHQKYKFLWGKVKIAKTNTKKDIRQKSLIFLPYISNQHFNHLIKIAAAKIGIDDDVTINEKRNGKMIKINTTKSKLITSVTGRRTFITHSLKDGIPMEVLMGATGHKDIKTLLRYAKIDQNTVNKEFMATKKRILPTEKWEQKKLSDFDDSNF